jgi:hypothetical protein
MTTGDGDPRRSPASAGPDGECDAYVDDPDGNAVEAISPIA